MLPNLPLDFTNFFKLERFLNLRPAIQLNTVYFLLVVFGAVLVAAIIFKIIQKVTSGDSFYKSLLQKYFVVFLTLGLIGLALTWFRYERVYVLSARFWLLVWLIGLVVWLAFVLKYQLKTVPRARTKLQKSKEFNKYLPKKK